MNPLFVSALTSIVRSILLIGATWLVEHGVWTQADAKTYVSAAALGIVSLAWSQRNVIMNRAKLLTVIGWAGVTENDVNAHVADKLPTPALSTPPDTIPGVPK